MEKHPEYLQKGVRRYIKKELEFKEKLNHMSGFEGCRVTKVIATGKLKIKLIFNETIERTEEENKFLLNLSTEMDTLRGAHVYTLDNDKALAKLGIEPPVDKERRPATKFVSDEHTLNRKLAHLTGYSGCQIIQYHDTGELKMFIKFDAETIHTDAENEFLAKIIESKIARPAKHTVYILDVDKALVELKMSRPKKEI